MCTVYVAYRPHYSLSPSLDCYWALVKELRKMTPRKSGSFRVEIVQADLRTFLYRWRTRNQSLTRYGELGFRGACDLEDNANRGSQDLKTDEVCFL